MKKIAIYEPAMCCSTGLCGVGVDPELLRISTVLDSLKKNSIIVDRYNLTNSPQEFVDNADINQLLTKEGVKILPVTVVDGKIIITKRYPTNDEFIDLLNVPRSFLGGESTSKINITFGEPKKIDNKGGGCC